MNWNNVNKSKSLIDNDVYFYVLIYFTCVAGIEIPYIDQTSLHPLIIKARIMAVFLMPFYFNVDSVISQLDEHRQYVSYMLKLSRLV